MKHSIAKATQRACKLWRLWSISTVSHTRFPPAFWLLLFKSYPFFPELSITMDVEYSSLSLNDFLHLSVGPFARPHYILWGSAMWGQGPWHCLTLRMPGTYKGTVASSSGQYVYVYRTHYSKSNSFSMLSEMILLRLKIIVFYKWNRGSRLESWLCA